MKKAFHLFIPILIFFSGCIQNQTKDKKNQITVSILPQKFFVEKIAGDKFKINVMLPPGANPATYEPTPRQMKNLSNSALYYRIGYIEFEKAWMRNIQSNNKELKVVDLSKGVNLIQGEDNWHVDHLHKGGTDPHIWMSPKSVKIQIKNIFNNLAKHDPGNKEYYRNNYQIFLAEIKELDERIENSLKNIKSRKFMIFHPALTYFARDYDLVQIPIEIEGKNPTPGHLIKIIDIAKKENIKLIFIQQQFDVENARTIAREINGEVIQIDPLAHDWLNNMIHITKILENALNN